MILWFILQVDRVVIRRPTSSRWWYVIRVDLERQDKHDKTMVYRKIVNEYFKYKEFTVNMNT